MMIMLIMMKGEYNQIMKESDEIIASNMYDQCMTLTLTLQDTLACD